MHNRRSFFQKSLGFLGGLSLPFLGSASSINEDRVIKGKFIHMVFFWLKEDVDIERFMNGTEAFLNEIKVVRQYHLGVPAGTPREVVDNTYTVSLVVTFDSKEDQDAYQKHQAHLDYVEKNKNSWNRVQIYDSWGQV